MLLTWLEVKWTWSSLTYIKVEIEKSPNKKTLVQAMEVAGMVFWSRIDLLLLFLWVCFVVKLLWCRADVKNKWENSSWGRKLIAQKRRAALMTSKDSRSWWPWICLCFACVLIPWNCSRKNSRGYNCFKPFMRLFICTPIILWWTTPLTHHLLLCTPGERNRSH